MKKHWCGIIATILLINMTVAIHASADSFEVLKRYFLGLSIGKNLQEIEKALNLPAPDKTYMGSSSYQDRLFRYYDYKGMMLQIGLVQHSIESAYEKGNFSYNGDFLIVDSKREYDHCCSNNGWSNIYDGPVRR